MIKRKDRLTLLREYPKTRDMEPIHPGEILAEEFLKPMSISQSKLASDLGISFRRVHEIVHGKRSVTAETAYLLAQYFGNSPEFWMGLQSEYELERIEDRILEQLQRVRPIKSC